MRKIVEWSSSVLIAAMLCITVSADAQSADIRLHQESTPELAIIEITGTFLPGDEKKFANFALQQRDAIVLLNSDGGNIIPAIEIGKAIRIKEFWTLVGYNGQCASACGLVWLGGTRRIAHPSARIGFHAAYETNGGEARESGWANAIVGAYLNQLGLPQSAIYYLTSSPPEGMQWLPLRQAKSLGIDLEIVEISQSSNPAPERKPEPLVIRPPASELKQVTGYDVFGFDLPKTPLKGITLYACHRACLEEPLCKAYTYNTPNSLCFLKSNGYRVIGNPNAVAGYKTEIEGRLLLSPITVVEKTDLPGGDYKSMPNSDFESCVKACEGDTRCVAFTFVQRHRVCWLKSSIPKSVGYRGAISGVKRGD